MITITNNAGYFYWLEVRFFENMDNKIEYMKIEYM